MSRGRWATVAFALFAALLVVAAQPAAASHQLATASMHTTDTDFSAGTLTNATVNGSGATATVELADTPTDSYGVVEDSGDGATDGTDTFVGDLGDNTRVNSSAKIVPDFSGTVNQIKVNAGATTGSDYGLVVDVYAVQEAPDGTYGEGTLIADDWDPDFSTGNQTIALDTTFEVSSGQTWTIEFVTQSTDSDGSADRIDINYDDSFTSTWYTTRGFTRDRGAQVYVESVGPATPGTYISQNHSAEQTEQGFTNLTTVTNATVTVTWETNDGSGWSTLNQTSGITTAANHTFTWAQEPNSTVRVNVTVFNQSGNGAPEFTLADEGVQFTANDTFVDNASATPTGDLTSADQTLQIDINDSDFPLAQGDSVAVEFFVDGSSVGTDTLTSNGTASTSHTFLGGSHTWSVEANDSYDHSQPSQTFSVNVPANLTIRNETSPYGNISGCTANVRFFETVNDNPVITEVSADSNGNVSLTGLPVGSEFVATVKCDGYNNRTVLIESLFDQQSAFLLHKSRDEAEITFTVDDRTGKFDDGELVVEKAINESEYNTSADGFRWLAVGGDELDAADSFVVILENEDRYRLRIQNDQGDSVILGPYIPHGQATERLVVGQVSWVATEGNATVFNASIEDSSNLGNPPPVIQIQFQDPKNSTENFNFTVYEAGNKSNQIGSGSASGTLGTFYAEVNVSESQANQKWIIEAQYDVDGESVTQQRVVGGSAVDIQADQDWIGLFALVGITSIGLLYGKRTANIGIAMMWMTAGIAMAFELIVISPAWYAVSGFIVAGGILAGHLRE